MSSQTRTRIDDEDGIFRTQNDPTSRNVDTPRRLRGYYVSFMGQERRPLAVALDINWRRPIGWPSRCRQGARPSGRRVGVGDDLTVGKGQSLTGCDALPRRLLFVVATEGTNGDVSAKRGSSGPTPPPSSGLKERGGAARLAPRSSVACAANEAAARKGSATATATTTNRPPCWFPSLARRAAGPAGRAAAGT
jgi:hypothetical protein